MSFLSITTSRKLTSFTLIRETSWKSCPKKDRQSFPRVKKKNRFHRIFQQPNALG